MTISNDGNDDNANVFVGTGRCCTWVYWAWPSATGGWTGWWVESSRGAGCTFGTLLSIPWQLLFFAMRGLVLYSPLSDPCLWCRYWTTAVLEAPRPTGRRLHRPLSDFAANGIRGGPVPLSARRVTVRLPAAAAVLLVRAHLPGGAGEQRQRGARVVSPLGSRALYLRVSSLNL